MPLTRVSGSDVASAYRALLSMLKDSLDIPEDDDFKDAALLRIVKSSVATVERETWRAIFSQVYRLDTWDFHTIRFPRPPFVSLTSVEYRDSEGDWQTLSADAYGTENVPASGETTVPPAILWYDRDEVSSLLLYDEDPYPVRITYAAGYGTDVASLPVELAEGIVLLARHRYLKPDACEPGMPAACQHYLKPFYFRDEAVAREVGA